jgi:hypothetical protein
MDIDLLRAHLKKKPPNIAYIKQILEAFRDGLCRFNPNKPEIHALIETDIPLDHLTVGTVPHIIDRFIHWMEQFQAPAHDAVTQTWRRDFETCTDYTDFICTFVDAYYKHSSQVYKEIGDARRRIANGETPIPPENRATGKRGVPDHMQSGR